MTNGSQSPEGVQVGAEQTVQRALADKILFGEIFQIFDGEKVVVDVRKDRVQLCGDPLGLQDAGHVLSQGVQNLQK